jgi:hypothetical protein
MVMRAKRQFDQNEAADKLAISLSSRTHLKNFHLARELAEFVEHIAASSRCKITNLSRQKLSIGAARRWPSGAVTFYTGDSLCP